MIGSFTIEHCQSGRLISEARFSNVITSDGHNEILDMIVQPQTQVSNMSQETKLFHIRVGKRDFSGHKNYFIHAYSEDDARMIAFGMDGGLHGDTVERRHREIVNQWTMRSEEHTSELQSR